ncbi:MAG TPA: hypothetical protein VGH28_21880 [Polyangiaceae bacterium]|jgi:hypothetical protein
MVHTKNGSVYYGELVERVTDDHVTIVNAAGEIKRFDMKDIDPAPAPVAPLYRPPEPEPPPKGTVRTKGGSFFYGEILERVANDHVTLRLATGDTLVIDWTDLDTSLPPPAYSPPRPRGPTETVRTKKGNVYHGDLIEKVVGNHVTLSLVTGEIVTVAWDDIVEHRKAGRPKPDTTLDFHVDKASAFLERKIDVGWQTLCTSSCGDVATPSGVYRVRGEGIMTSDSFRLSGTTDNVVVASSASRDAHTAGIALVLFGAPLLIVGAFFTAAAIGANPWNDNGGIDGAAIGLDTSSLAMLAGGIGLLVPRTSVKVNGETVARAVLEGVRF